MLKKVTSIFAAAAVAAGTVSALPASADEPAMRDITTMEVVREMGLGVNLGNTFESCGSWLDGANSTVTTYETGWGSPEITQEMIQGYADEGFGSIRIPVAWSNMIGDDYTINADYIARVKQVTEWALDAGMYAIVNIHWDSGWWDNFPTDTEGCMYRYERMWTQIADAFKDYDDHLIFESLNEEGGWDSMNTDKSYELLNEINQKFVDIVRNSGGNNAERHLLIAGYQTNIDKTCDSRFKMPDDPENRCAVSVHYYDPPQFAILTEDASWGKAKTEWGTQDEIDYLNEQMDLLKTTFVDNGIPVIIGEYGVGLENKTQDQVVNFLSQVAEAAYTRGMCPMLWDIYYGDGTYTNYDRINCKLKNSDLKAAYSSILEEDVKKPCTITSDSSEITVSYADGTFKFAASTDSNGTVRYSSSNEEIFTIDQSGNVTVKKSGTADIVVHVDSTDTYLPATPLKVSVTVSKIENPPTAPDEEITVEYSAETTDDVELPDGWSWSKRYELIPGETVEATAIYGDTNYKNRKVKVLITRKTEEESADSSSETDSTADSDSSAESTASNSTGNTSSVTSSASGTSSTSSAAAKTDDASPSTGVGGGLAGLTIALAAAVVIGRKSK